MSQASAIVSPVEVVCVGPAGEPIPVSTDFVYDPLDPYALSMVFHTAREQAHWTFSRDLLDQGLFEPTGVGDVHIWPSVDGAGHAVAIIELSSADGRVTIEAPARPLHAFNLAIRALVPPGEEGSYVDERELRELLVPSAPASYRLLPP